MRGARPTGADALDPDQRAAVRTEARRVLVLAGAGSGKTATLTHRVAHLVRERAVAPERILLLTFTQRAAREMKSRVEQLLGPSGRRVRAGTFHALALREVRAHHRTLGLPSTVRILDRAETATLASEALIEAGIDPRGQPGLSAGRFVALLGRADNDERSLEDVLLELEPDRLPQLAALELAADTFARAKARVGALGFDDLLVLWRVLLDPEGPLSERLTAALDHVLVDEYQDTTAIQAGIAEDLARSAALFVVGDDAQAIYGFRGARFENILEMPTFAPTEVHRLVTSYRSVPSVVALAKAALDNNPLQFPKPLRSALSEGPPVRCLVGDDEADEARRIAKTARAALEAGSAPEDMAVLVRRHRDTGPVELALAAESVPFRVKGGRRFLDRPHVADALAHVRVVVDPSDALAWRRVWHRCEGVGPKTAAQLAEQLPTETMAGETLRIAMARTSVSGRARAGLGRLLDLFERLERASEAGWSAMCALLLEDAADRLVTEAEDEGAARDDLARLVGLGPIPPREALDRLATEDVATGPEPSQLTISTIHGAKGLEWRTVFVVGLVDGRFPGAAALRETDGEAEERRLFYVAVTRAREQLYLCRPSWSATRGGRMALAPSRFLDELDTGLLGER